MKNIKTIKGLEIKYVVAIIISLIIGGSILGYGYLDYKYKKEALEQKAQSESQARLQEALQQESAEQQVTLKQKQLQECLDGVDKRFRDSYTDVSKSGSMTNESVKILLDFYQKQKDECFKKYPLK